MTLRILWHSNHPAVCSGYGTQTALIVPRLAALGHDIAIVPTQGVPGMAKGEWNGIPVYPAGAAPWSEDVLGMWYRHFDADLCISFVDSWVLNPLTWSGRTRGVERWVPYFPVDHEPIPENVASPIGRFAWESIAYSRHGQEMAKRVGIEARYVTHGVDTEALRPLTMEDRAEARRLLVHGGDCFIVGVVAANNDPLPSRKNWHGIFDGFARFRSSYTGKTVLYLHTWLDGAVDLAKLIAQYDLGDAVVTCDPVGQRLGFDQGHMCATYNAFDVLLSPSHGEGFGLPILEAAACGVPAIIGDWTAMPEAAGQACIKILKASAAPLMTPFHALQWMAGGEIIAKALTVMAERTPGEVREMSAEVREHAQSLDIDRVVAEHWGPTLTAFEERIREEEDRRRRGLRAQTLASDLTNRALDAGRAPTPKASHEGDGRTITEGKAVAAHYAAIGAAFPKVTFDAGAEVAA